MPQLDLFGAVINTPATDNKTPPKQAFMKREEKAVVDVEVADISASEIAPSQEMSAIDKLKARGEKPAGKEEQKKALPAAGLVSLFDPPLATEEEKAALDPNETFAVESGSVWMSPPEVSAETYTEETESDAAGDRTQAEPIQAEQASLATTELPGEIAVEKDRAVDFVNKNSSGAQRNGTVIFDDGKISVKIKAKPSVAAEVVEQKQEKLKKEPQKRGRKSFKEIDASSDLIEVPEDEILFQKQYYPISEVAGWFKVNTSLLRFWENEFDVLAPRKNRKGDRLFRPEDVRNLQLIHHLLRERKYTIEGAKEYIKTHKKKADIQLQLTQTLQKFKSFLLDLKANLQP